MKKYFFTLSTACMFTIASVAQTAPTTNKGGIILKGGVNFANVTITDGGNIEEAKTLASFNVGILADFPLSKYLSVQPGIIYSGKGSKTQRGSESGSNYYRATINPMYVELPVNLVGKIPLTGAANVFFGAGPYVAMGVAGKKKAGGKIFGVTFKSDDDIVFSNDDPSTSQEENEGFGKIKRFDYGFNALAGIDFGKYMLSANYGYGLAKLNSGTDNTANDNNKNRVVSISLGIKL